MHPFYGPVSSNFMWKCFFNIFIHNLYKIREKKYKKWDAYSIIKLKIILQKSFFPILFHILSLKLSRKSNTVAFHIFEYFSLVFSFFYPLPKLYLYKLYLFFSKPDYLYSWALLFLSFFLQVYLNLVFFSLLFLFFFLFVNNLLFLKIICSIDFELVIP